MQSGVDSNQVSCMSIYVMHCICAGAHCFGHLPSLLPSAQHEMPAPLSFTTAHLLCCGFTITCLWPVIHCLLQFLSETTVAYTMTYENFELCMQVKSAGLKCSVGGWSSRTCMMNSCYCGVRSGLTQ